MGSRSRQQEVMTATKVTGQLSSRALNRHARALRPAATETRSGRTGSGMSAAIQPARMRPARVTGVTRWTRLIISRTIAVIAPLSAAANGCSCPPRTESSR